MDKEELKQKIKRKYKEIKRDLTNKAVAIIFFMFAGFVFWIFMQLLYTFYDFSLFEWVKGLPYVYDIFSHVFNEIQRKSDIGIFYLFTITSLFFLPVPLEVLFRHTSL